ncbi:unnamed protein product [Nesidiocoris tenuis]|uniref:Protein-tyrosine-phosphatase n=1 Tax=Nesidiocoris tenuis TaxID=355587 RepID=A0A6H5H7I0_9HEMI|nr:unnamed protein product [Nesidiocoris tenuis]
MNPQLPMNSWESRMVDNNQLTTISELTPHTIYTIRVQAFTSVGPGPLSPPVLVKTQQGVPSQPGNLHSTDIGESSVTLSWTKPTHAGENIVSYELYWNDTYAKEKNHRRIPITETYTLTNLYPNTLYYIWLAARSQRGEGATTPPIHVRTKQYVPGAPPQNVTGEAVSPTSVRVSWEPPPAERSNGRIVYYKLQVVEAGRSDSEAMMIRLNDTSITLDELKRWTEYRIWVLAGTSVGDGPPSYPIVVRTHEDALTGNFGGGVEKRISTGKNLQKRPLVPGHPQDVKVNTINSTAVHVTWKPPAEKNRNGIIRGYHIHVQETKEEGKGMVNLNEPMRFDVLDGNALEINITGLQPDTNYNVQVAALTRKGDGDRSEPVNVKTPGGVPNRPTVTIKYDVQFQKKLDQSTIMDRNTTHTKAVFSNLEESSEYSFSVRAHTKSGSGPWSDKTVVTTDRDIVRAPMGVRAVATSDQSVEVWWESVPSRTSIIAYQIFYTMTAVEDLDQWQTKTVPVTESADLVNLEKFAQYAIAVAAKTKQGLGRLSEKVRASIQPWLAILQKKNELLRSSPNPRKYLKIPQQNALNPPLLDCPKCPQFPGHTSDSIGLPAIPSAYQLFKFPFAFQVTVKVKPEDVPLNLRAHDVSTHSMTLSWSPPIRLNPINYKISFDAVKEFVDSQGITQTQIVPRRTALLEPLARTHTINELSPFTTYNVNVSAIPSDHRYRPPARIMVTTQMAAPQPMVKPDFYGVVNGEEIQVILPQASEEYGPISHYFLVVVPDDKLNFDKNPDQFLTDVSIEPGQQFTWDHSNMEVNKPKNRYANVIAYDHSRVILTPIDGIPGSDYINANFCDGYRKHNAYVATQVRWIWFLRQIDSAFRIPSLTLMLHFQGPLGDTCSDFWRMVWELRSSTIVMMTKLEERARIKCDQYWPTRGSETYGMITVSVSDVQELATYCIRTFHINRTEDQYIFIHDALLEAVICGNSEVPARNLHSHIQKLMQSEPGDTITGMELEFKRLSNIKTDSSRFLTATLPVNKHKNRLVHILPLESSRVCLQPIRGVEGSDYINASIIDGYRQRSAYIATQGPLPETTEDLWRMLWEHNSTIVVMLTKLKEMGRFIPKSTVDACYLAELFQPAFKFEMFGTFSCPKYEENSSAELSHMLSPTLASSGDRKLQLTYDGSQKSGPDPGDAFASDADPIPFHSSSFPRIVLVVLHHAVEINQVKAACNQQLGFAFAGEESGLQVGVRPRVVLPPT